MPPQSGTSVPKKIESFLKNALLLSGVVLVCLLLFEALSRLIIDDGKSYELEMWKYARNLKIRDPATRSSATAIGANRDAER